MFATPSLTRNVFVIPRMTAQKDVSLALLNQLGETSKGSGGGGGGAISLADYCSLKPCDALGSRLQ